MTNDNRRSSPSPVPTRYWYYCSGYSTTTLKVAFWHSVQSQRFTDELSTPSICLARLAHLVPALRPPAAAQHALASRIGNHRRKRAWMSFTSSHRRQEGSGAHLGHQRRLQNPWATRGSEVLHQGPCQMLPARGSRRLRMLAKLTASRRMKFLKVAL